MFKVIAYIIEVINWVNIMLSPTLIAGLFAVLIILNYPTTIGYSIGVALVCIGFLIGVLWATHIWKKIGTTTFMARIYASPDIDDAVRPKGENK